MSYGGVVVCLQRSERIGMERLELTGFSDENNAKQTDLYEDAMSLCSVVNCGADDSGIRL